MALVLTVTKGETNEIVVKHELLDFHYLTVNIQSEDSLGCGRHAVVGRASVVASMSPVHAGQEQRLSHTLAQTPPAVGDRLAVHSAPTEDGRGGARRGAGQH